MDVFEGHHAPVTGISPHSGTGSGAMDFSHLFLTASFDWSIKLWSLKVWKFLMGWICSFFVCWY